MLVGSSAWLGNCIDVVRPKPAASLSANKTSVNFIGSDITKTSDGLIFYFASLPQFRSRSFRQLLTPGKATSLYQSVLRPATQCSWGQRRTSW
jgi:hypothetical protein